MLKKNIDENGFGRLEYRDYFLTYSDELAQDILAVYKISIENLFVILVDNFLEHRQQTLNLAPYDDIGLINFTVTFKILEDSEVQIQIKKNIIAV